MSWSSLSINVFWFLQKDLFKGKWWLAKSYFKQICCHSCHTRFAVFFPLPSCCVSSLIIQPLNESWLILSWHYCTVCAARAGTCTQFHQCFHMLSVFYNNIPWAWMGSESIAHEAEGQMGNWLRGHKGKRNNCFSKIQLVGQKYWDKTTLASKMRFSCHCFGFQSQRFSLLVHNRPLVGFY